jgi:cAMP-specific phosphodiesterase 4
VSVNENGHYHVLRALLTKRGLLDAMFAKKEEKLAFLATLRRLILATDMENHTRLVADFLDIVQAAHDERGAGGEDAPLRVGDLSDPTLAICFTLHCADVSNPARPFETCRRWGECIAEESYKQGDKERQLGMRVAAFCDRELSTPSTTAQNQVSFIDFVCGPMVEGLSAILPDAAEELLHHLAVNREKYGAIIGELRS